jgi:hypothetical protein
MRRLSAPSTVFYKRVAPLICLGGSAVLAGVLYLNKTVPSLLALGIPALGVAGYFGMRWNFSDLADEVLDAGDSLIVRMGNEEERVPLSNIAEVDWIGTRQGARITITLQKSGRFGDEFSFLGPFRSWWSASGDGSPPIAAELLERAQKASA